MENTIAIWVVLTSLTASWTSTRLCCEVNDDTCATSENDWKNKSSRLASANFRLQVAITFCQMGIKLSLSYKWSLKSDIQAKKHKGPAQRLPRKAVRQDQIGPWSQRSDKKIRCKFPNRGRFTNNVCEKCGVT